MVVQHEIVKGGEKLFDCTNIALCTGADLKDVRTGFDWIESFVEKKYSDVVSLFPASGCLLGQLTQLKNDRGTRSMPFLSRTVVLQGRQQVCKKNVGLLDETQDGRR